MPRIIARKAQADVDERLRGWAERDTTAAERRTAKGIGLASRKESFLRNKSMRSSGPVSQRMYVSGDGTRAAV
ncbi:hypothetical protein JOL79_27245 [Microbispora sp. RL4-1S]|uniref:Uncharacterized protein n=1 Tax=Microbispora oryzae TaxID=2806554 RepID=A0A940WV40_9ACTN|nr:hypothetical protein [Microbispora oryzae]MBP2707484.1 hypothetical protein [Microbispora oryzae]